MISLGAVEEAAVKALADDTVEFAAVALPDEKRAKKLCFLPQAYRTSQTFAKSSLRRASIPS